ncbi:hypothetical protein EV1_017503 [Malus domestica]
MVESFKQVFDEIPERNRLCWNVTISRYVRCRRFEEALDMFRRMSCESNEKLDEATVVTTISACTASKTLELGKEIHEYVRSKLGFTTRTGNVVVEYVYNTIVLTRRYSKRCKLKELKGDKFTAIALLTGCAPLGALEQGEWIHGYIEYNRIKN